MRCASVAITECLYQDVLLVVVHAALPFEPHSVFFFFNDTATIEIYTSVHTLSLHDALPIWYWVLIQTTDALGDRVLNGTFEQRSEEHTSELQSRTLISYAVFCLKKKKR